MSYRGAQMPLPSRTMGRALATGVLAAALLGVAGCSGVGGVEPARSTQAGAPSSAGTSADDAAVRDLLDRYIAAWNDGDGQEFGAAYAPRATHVTFDGALLSGRADITKVHTQLFSTFLRDSRIELEVDGLRFVSDDVAVLHTSGGIVEAGDAALSADRRSMNTMVAAKHADRWLFETIQVTRISSSTPPG